MKLIATDTAKCVKCRACAEVCPMGVIEISDDGTPKPTTDAYKLCINCGYCVDVCVADALRHRVRRRSSDSGAALKRYAVLKKKKKDKLGELNEK